MESLLYSIVGLPVHPLVVHFAVVILPLSTIALIAIIYTPRIKVKYSFIAAAGIVLGSAAVLVAKQSGEALAEKIGTPVVHADYGSLLTIAAFIFMVLTIIWYQSAKGRKSRTATLLSHITALAGVAVLILTFLTGHSGAEAVWKGRLPESSPTATSTPTTSKSGGSYTSSDLQKHSDLTSCWSVVNGEVYDLTRWINSHPGGKSAITSICGRDGSSAFNGEHAGKSDPLRELAKFKIGNFS